MIGVQVRNYFSLSVKETPYGGAGRENSKRYFHTMNFCIEPNKLPSPPIRLERRWPLFALACVVFFAASLAGATPLIIDEFSDALSQTSSNAQLDGSMAGGEVDVSFSNGNVVGSFEITGGEGKLTAVTNGSESSFKLIYDGNDDSNSLDVTGLGGIDLTDSGANDRFAIDMNSVTGTVGLEIRVFTDGSNASILDLGSFTEAGMVEVLFTDLNPYLGGGADFANVGMIGIYLAVDSGDAVDIDSILARDATVPPEADPDPDTTAPSLTISGKKELKTPRRSHRLKGTASDDNGVTLVQVKAPGSRYKTAKFRGGSRWIYRLRNLRSGRNRIKIRAYDAAGNTSRIKRAVAVGL